MGGAPLQSTRPERSDSGATSFIQNTPANAKTFDKFLKWVPYAKGLNLKDWYVLGQVVLAPPVNSLRNYGQSLWEVLKLSVREDMATKTPSIHSAFRSAFDNAALAQWTSLKRAGVKESTFLANNRHVLATLMPPAELDTILANRDNLGKCRPSVCRCHDSCQVGQSLLKQAVEDCGAEDFSDETKKAIADLNANTLSDASIEECQAKSSNNVECRRECIGRAKMGCIFSFLHWKLWVGYVVCFMTAFLVSIVPK